MVSGEPGIGKSRLAREMVAQAEVSGGQTFTGECQPEGNAPYSAFAQIVRRILREHAKNGVEFPMAVLADMLKLSPELKSLYPNVDPNPELEPGAEQRRLFEHMVGLCQVMSKEAPLLLLLEDLHWADSSTLAMLSLLARRTIGIPIMLLGAYREVELGVALPFHQAMQEFDRQNLGKRLKLDRLDKEQTKNLVTTIFAEETTPEFLDGIYNETDGNPFFIEEVCKALIESGQLTFKDGRWDRPSMEELSIPQGVKVAIQSRVAKLSEETQGVLLFAAVIGRAFDYSTLEKVAGRDDETLIDCLEEALHAQLIQEIQETGSEGFSFTHAMIPLSLRESVSGLRRSRLHRKVAEAIEKTSPDDYERMAHHWGEAGSDEKGLNYTIKAAKRAQDSYANQEAARLYTEALSLLPDEHPQRYELLAGRAKVYQVIGEYEKQRADAEAMLSIAEHQDDPKRKMDALLGLAENSLASDYQKVVEHTERVIAIAEPAGDKGRLGRAYSLLGQQYQRRFNMAKSQEYLEKAAPLLSEAGLLKAAADNLSYLSVVLRDLDKEAALQAAQEAQEISSTTEDKQLRATTTRRVALAQLSNYRFEEALHTSQNALNMFRKIGDRSGELYAINAQAIINKLLGNFRQAEHEFLEVLKIAEEIGEDAGQRWGISNLLVMYNVQMGEYEKGLRLAETHAEEARQQSNEFVLLNHMARIQEQLYLMGQYQKALDIALINLPLFEKNFDPILQAFMKFFLSELYYRVGDEIEGQRSFAKGYRLMAEHEFTPLQESYIWDNILTVSLLHPAAFPFENILPKMETIIHTFRGKHHLDGLVEALYSISRLHLALSEEDRAHIEKAMAALQEAEETKKMIQPQNMLIEHQLYLHARAHRLAEQDEQADDYLKQAHNWLMACAEKITTPEYRQSYLEKVPENVALQAAYQDRFGARTNVGN